MGGSGEQPRVAGTLWLLGSPSKRETPGSIWGSSACLCFKHSLHKRKNFPEFYGSVYVKVSFAISRTANAVGVFYQSSPSLERDPEQWEPAQGVGLSKPQDTCSFVPGCLPAFCFCHGETVKCDDPRHWVCGGVLGTRSVRVKGGGSSELLGCPSPAHTATSAGSPPRSKRCTGFPPCQRELSTLGL